MDNSFLLPISTLFFFSLSFSLQSRVSTSTVMDFIKLMLFGFSLNREKNQQEGTWIVRYLVRSEIAGQGSYKGEPNLHDKLTFLSTNTAQQVFEKSPKRNKCLPLPISVTVGAFAAEMLLEYRSSCHTYDVAKEDYSSSQLVWQNTFL
ncbi:hypothetical protein C5167_027288 [Papaver somniferum]|nr:hypothetical protein C5167_027288 [Papaver somniferum]